MNHKRPPKTPKLLLVNHGKPANLADNLGPKNDFLRPNMQSQSPFCPGPFVSIHPHGHFETAFFFDHWVLLWNPRFQPKRRIQLTSGCQAELLHPLPGRETESGGGVFSGTWGVKHYKINKS